MKNIKSIAIVVGLFASTFSLAGSMTNTTITRLEMAKSQENWILVDASGAKSADCSATGGWEFSLKTDTDYGKQMLSLLMSAYVAGKKVNLIGYSSPVCGYSDIEELDKIRLVQ